MCQDPKKMLDPQDPGSLILEDLGSYIFTFSWDLRYFGSCHGNISVESWGSWILDRKDSSGSWGSCVQPAQVVLGSSRSSILPNNNVTVFWTTLTSNEVLLLVPHPHIYALPKLERCSWFQPYTDSIILRWLGNKLALLVPTHVFYYTGFVNRMWLEEDEGTLNYFVKHEG